MTLNVTFGNFAEQLIALRDHYQAQLAAHEQQAVHAREQLSHINALLLDQLVSPETAVLEELSNGHSSSALLAAAVEQLQESAPLPAKLESSPSKRKPTAKSKPPKKPVPTESKAESPELEIQAAAPTASAPVSTAPAPRETEVDTESGDEPQPEDLPKRNSRIILPLQAPYEGMSKIDATTKVMQEQAGKILHVDDLIHALFGELSTEDLKAERVRMKSVMTQGIKSGRWVKVKNVPSSYVIDSVLEGAGSEPPKQAPAKGKKPRGSSRRRPAKVSV